MTDPFEPMYRLAKRGAGLACDEDGVALGPVTLVERVSLDGKRRYRRRPAEEIARALTLAYGPLPPDDLARRVLGLDVAARALEAGDLARASIATVQMKLPALSAYALVKLGNDQRFMKYSEDQPRDARGRWANEENEENREATNAEGANLTPTAADTGIHSDADGWPPISRDTQGGGYVTLTDGTIVTDHQGQPLKIPPKRVA